MSTASSPVGSRSTASGSKRSRDEGREAGGRTSGRRLATVVANLTDRDRAVLASLQVLHYATTRQLQRLQFQEGMAASSATRVAQRTLARLRQLGLIEHLDRRVGGGQAGSASHIWTLAPIGARAIAHPTRHRLYEPGPLHLGHVLAVGDLFVELIARARSGAYDLLSIQTEPECWRPYISSYGGRSWLKPDLRLTIGVGPFELHWFIEVDRSTSHRPALRRKNVAYVAAWRGGGEEARAGVFPRVLWVVPDAHRAELVADTFASIADGPPDLFHVVEASHAVEVIVASPS